MATLTIDQVVAQAYQAGFRGTGLVNATAIAERESSGNPQAHNTTSATHDDSYGLMQINMLGNLGQQRDALFRQNIPGYTDANSLLDPAINMQAAYLLSAHGTNFNPWGAYKGVSNLHNTDVATAQAAVARFSPGAVDVGGGGGAFGLNSPNFKIPGGPLGNLILGGPFSWLGGGNPLKGVTDAAKVVGQTFGVLTAILAKLVSVDFWKRIGLAIIGIVLIWLAITFVTKQKTEGVLESVGGSALVAGAAG